MFQILVDYIPGYVSNTRESHIINFIIYDFTFIIKPQICII